MLSNGSTEIVGINNMISRSLFFELALISIFGFARTWNTVVAHKEGMSIGYTIIRHLGLLCAYCYVCKLISCIVSSNSPNSAYKAHKIVLYSLLFVVSVTMFFISYTWQRWDISFLIFCAIFATISLLQLILAVDGFGFMYISTVLLTGMSWGIVGLYSDSLVAWIFVLFIVIKHQYGLVLVIYFDEMKSIEEDYIARIKRAEENKAQVYSFLRSYVTFLPRKLFLYFS